MHVIGGSAALSIHRPGEHSAVGIGVFDGVHRGHQRLLCTVVALAKSERLTSVAYTFNPHPARVLAPALAPRLIQPVEERLELIAALGVDTVVIEPFSRAFAAIEPEAFVRDTLVNGLGAKHVVVGSTFCFGARQRGDVTVLRALGEELGFEVHAIDAVRVDGIVVSSTKVREFVAQGQMEGVKLLLGRNFALTGMVVRGAARGTTIGFPTANLDSRNELLPAIGVYAAHASGPFGDRLAVVNVGYSPTFGGEAEPKVEAHLLDYEGVSLYGAVITLQFAHRLRDEQRFDGIEALKRQIGSDIERARRMLQPRGLA